MDESTANLFQNAAGYYGLGPIEITAEFKHGVANHNVLVRAGQGEYVLKIVHEHTLDETRLQAAYLERLKEYNVPLPPSLHGDDGGWIYIEGDQHVVGFEKVEGEAPENNPATCAVIGKALAELHTIPYDGLPPKADHWMTASYLPEKLEALRGQPLKNVDRASETYDRLKDFDLDALPQAIVHVDIHADNLIFENGELRAILDWEEVGVGAALMDMAGVILNPCFTDEGIDPERFQAFMKTYQGVRPLEADELDKLRTAVQWAGLVCSIWPLYRFGRADPNARQVGWSDFYWKHNLDEIELPPEL